MKLNDPRSIGVLDLIVDYLLDLVTTSRRTLKSAQMACPDAVSPKLRSAFVSMRLDDEGMHGRDKAMCQLRILSRTYARSIMRTRTRIDSSPQSWPKYGGGSVSADSIPRSLVDKRGLPSW